MQIYFYNYIDGKRISVLIHNCTLYINDSYNDFRFEMALDGVVYLVNVLKNLRHFRGSHVHLAKMIRADTGYQKCWSNNFVVARTKPVFDLLNTLNEFEINKDRLEKFNINDLKYIEAKLPSGVKKVDGKTLISLF